MGDYELSGYVGMRYLKKRVGLWRHFNPVESYKGRGVSVPPGQSAAQIMEGAWVLEREFDIAPYISRMMASAVLAAAAATTQPSGKQSTPDG